MLICHFAPRGSRRSFSRSIGAVSMPAARRGRFAGGTAKSHLKCPLARLAPTTQRKIDNSDSYFPTITRGPSSHYERPKKGGAVRISLPLVRLVLAGGVGFAFAAPPANSKIPPPPFPPRPRGGNARVRARPANTRGNCRLRPLKIQGETRAAAPRRIRPNTAISRTKRH